MKFRALSGCGRYFFTHQYVDDSFRSSMFSGCLDTQPIGRKIVYKNNAPSVFSKKAAFSVAGNFGSMLRPIFIQSIVFFISQIRHSFLLSVEKREKCIPAFHCMEYPQIPLINYIIHYFQQISIAVKPYQQVFFIIVIKYIVISPVQYSVPYIFLSYAMFESRGDTFDSNFHIFILTQTRKENN